MGDIEIIWLYFKRCETAIVETASKYGKYCYKIAINILSNHEDAEETVNDTYLAVWNRIPPNRPASLSQFLGKITRDISIDRWRKNNAQKRGCGEMVLVIDELSECISDSNSLETVVEQRRLNMIINRFVLTLPVTEAQVFLCRYWYMDSIKSISRNFGFTESKVKSMLQRTRGKLQQLLIKEGLYETR